MQLDLYCQQWDNGTKSAMSRHIYHYLTGFYQGQKTLMVQRSKVASKPLPDNKTQEEKANEEINLINALNPRDTGLVAGWPPQSPNPLLDTPEIGSREPTAPPLYDEGRVSPSKTHQGTQFGKWTSLFRARHFPFRQYPISGVNQVGQPTGHYWAHTLFSTSDLLN